MTENPFSKAIRSKKSEPQEEPEPAIEVPEAIAEVKPKRGRGRPATGKRSNADWVGRTFYIRQETDLDVEEALLKLKRLGNEMDKSELVDFLLSEWVKTQKSSNS